MPLGGGVGPAHHEAPVRPLRQRGPHLLTVEDPLVALEPRRGADVGQVAPRVRLAVALAPVLGARHDPGQEPALLLGVGEVDERRPEQALTDEPGAARTTGPRVLLVEDDLLGQRQAAAPVLDRATRRTSSSTAARWRSHSMRSSTRECSSPGPPRLRNDAKDPVRFDSIQSRISSAECFVFLAEPEVHAAVLLPIRRRATIPDAPSETGIAGRDLSGRCRRAVVALVPSAPVSQGFDSGGPPRHRVTWVAVGAAAFVVVALVGLTVWLANGHTQDIDEPVASPRSTTSLTDTPSPSKPPPTNESGDQAKGVGVLTDQAVVPASRSLLSHRRATRSDQGRESARRHPPSRVQHLVGVGGEHRWLAPGRAAGLGSRSCCPRARVPVGTPADAAGSRSAPMSTTSDTSPRCSTRSSKLPTTDPVADLRGGGVQRRDDGLRVRVRPADRVAAIVSAEGTPVSNCKPARPIPVLHIHGRADQTVPYNGGQSLDLVPPRGAVPVGAESVGKVARGDGVQGPVARRGRRQGHDRGTGPVAAVARTCAWCRSTGWAITGRGATPTTPRRRSSPSSDWGGDGARTVAPATALALVARRRRDGLRPPRGRGGRRGRDPQSIEPGDHPAARRPAPRHHPAHDAVRTDGPLQPDRPPPGRHQPSDLDRVARGRDGRGTPPCGDRRARSRRLGTTGARGRWLGSCGDRPPFRGRVPPVGGWLLERRGVLSARDHARHR